ncbi:MAG: Fur family transcriptional regulator [Planctomycetota bacterium]|nr:Fur family transcriptional regulator [Planctomycetota bacterium]
MTTARPATTVEEPLIQPLCAIFRRFLKRQDLKFTPERAKILDAVLSKPGVFEADELLFEMRQTGHRVSKATIYRTLKHLIEAGIITEVLLDAKQAHYQLSFGLETKGHLVNVDDHRIVEFTTPELTTIARRICKENGLDLVSFRYVVYGVKPESSKAKGA